MLNIVNIFRRSAKYRQITAPPSMPSEPTNKPETRRGKPRPRPRMPLSAERMRTEFSSPPSAAAVLQRELPEGGAEVGGGRRNGTRKRPKPAPPERVKSRKPAKPEAVDEGARGNFPNQRFRCAFKRQRVGIVGNEENLMAEDGRASGLSPASHRRIYPRWPDANSARVDCQSARPGA